MPSEPLDRRDEITADYTEFLGAGYVENWKFELGKSYNDSESHSSGLENWWSALERLASSDGLPVKRGWSNLGAGNFLVPHLRIVRRDGTDYGPNEPTVPAAAERGRQIQDDWGDKLAQALTRYGSTASE